MDKLITRYIRQSGRYHVIAEAPYWDKFGTGRFTIWAYQPAMPTAARRRTGAGPVVKARSS